MTRSGSVLLPDAPTMRADKWLWAVRLFKTRELSATACQGGAVRIGAHPIKAGRDLRLGEVLAVRQGALHRVVKVVGIPRQRVSASEVQKLMEDLTPPAEYARVAELDRNDPHRMSVLTGKPNKKERRTLSKFWRGEEES